MHIYDIQTYVMCVVNIMIHNFMSKMSIRWVINLYGCILSQKKTKKFSMCYVMVYRYVWYTFGSWRFKIIFVKHLTISIDCDMTLIIHDNNFYETSFLSNGKRYDLTQFRLMRHLLLLKWQSDTIKLWYQ